MRDQLFERPVVERDADDRAVEQPAALEPVERPEGHHAGEVARDAEDHEDVGRSRRRELRGHRQSISGSAHLYHCHHGRPCRRSPPSIRACSVARGRCDRSWSRTRSSASSPPCSCSRRRCCWRASPRARFGGASLADVARRSCCSPPSSSPRAVAAWGFEVAGRRAATRRALAAAARPRRGAPPRTAGGARRRRERRGRDGGGRAASTRSRRLFARYLPQLVAGAGRPGRGSRARRLDRPRSPPG